MEAEAGDVRRGRDIGKNSDGWFMYSPCEQCDKPRWVRWVKKHSKVTSSVTRMCIDCHRLNYKQRKYASFV
jgi:hypothetical protein